MENEKLEKVKTYLKCLIGNNKLEEVFTFFRRENKEVTLKEVKLFNTIIATEGRLNSLKKAGNLNTKEEKGLEKEKITFALLDCIDELPPTDDFYISDDYLDTLSCTSLTIEKYPNVQIVEFDINKNWIPTLSVLSLILIFVIVPLVKCKNDGNMVIVPPIVDTTQEKPPLPGSNKEKWYQSTPPKEPEKFPPYVQKIDSIKTDKPPEIKPEPEPELPLKFRVKVVYDKSTLDCTDCVVEVLDNKTESVLTQPTQTDEKGIAVLLISKLKYAEKEFYTFNIKYKGKELPLIKNDFPLKANTPTNLIIENY